MADVEQVIYCGPNLPSKYGLRQHTVFLNGLPDYVAALIMQCPAIKVLIVPVDDLTATRIAIAKTGSMQSVMYKTIADAF